MTDDDRIDLLDIFAYVDGFMDRDPGRKAAFEQRLQSDSEAMARVRAYQLQNEHFRADYAETMSGPVPERLIAAVQGPPHRNWRAVWKVAAVVALTAFSGAAGWCLGQADQRAALTFADFIEDAGTGLGEADVLPLSEAPASVLADGGNSLESVPFHLAVPDLSDLGYAIVDRQTLRSASGPVRRLTYVSADGRRFSLFLKARWMDRDTELRVEQDDNISLALWMDGPIASAVVSKLSARETRTIAEMVRRTMRHQSQIADTAKPTTPGESHVTGVPMPPVGLGGRPGAMLPDSGTIDMTPSRVAN